MSCAEDTVCFFVCDRSYPNNLYIYKSRAITNIEEGLSGKYISIIVMLYIATSIQMFSLTLLQNRSLNS